MLFKEIIFYLFECKQYFNGTIALLKSIWRITFRDKV